MSKGKLVLVFLLTLTTLVAVMPLTSASGDWPMFRQNPQHTGTTQTENPAASAKQLWNFTTDAAVASSPAVADGIVVVGCKDRCIYGLNASNGAKLWFYRTGGEVDSSPAIYGGYTYVGSVDGFVYCLNASSGKLQWSADALGAVRSSPCIVNRLVYLGSAYGVWCLSAETGATVWVYQTDKQVDSSPAVADGVVYVNCNDFYTYKLDAQSGQLKWRFYYPRCDTSSTLISGNRVYVGSYYGEVTCLDTSTGEQIWQTTLQDTVQSSPALTDGRLYVGCEDSCVYCLNASNGVIIWQTKTGYFVCSSPCVAAGCVFVGSQDYALYCLNASDGAVKWKLTTGNIIDSSPCIVGDVLYFGSFDCHLYAYQLSNESATMQTAAAPVLWSSLAFAVFMFSVWATVLGVSARFLYLKRNRWMWRPQVTRPTRQNLKTWFENQANLNLAAIVAITGFAIAFYINTAFPPLWAADEKTYSQMAYHMTTSGDYFTPWTNGESAVWIGKPPVLMWLIACSYQVFGAGLLSTRVWMLLFGVLSLITVFYLAKKLFTSQVALVSVLVLGTFWTFFQFASRAMTDGPLLFFMLASIYFGLQAEENRSVKLGALSGVFFGLALVTKQFEALLIPLVLGLYWLVTNRSVRFLVTKRFTAFWTVAAAFFLPWVTYMALRYSDFIGWFLNYNNFDRFTVAIEGHNGGPFFYLQYLFTTEVWAYLLPFALAFCIYRVAKRSKPDLLLIIWVLTVFGVFTFAQTKLYWYILPAMPAFAIIIANLLFSATQRLQRHT